MIRTSVFAIISAAALAACGGKSKGDTTTPATGGGTVAHTDGSGAGSAVDHDHPGDATPPDAAVEPVEPAADPHEALMAAETAAYEKAKPVFASRCGTCHISGGAKATAKTLGHLDLTSYPFGGHHTDTITTTIRHVLGVDGARPTMPKDKPGSVKGDELALITAWAAAYDASEDGGAHDDHEHGDAHDDHDDD